MTRLDRQLEELGAAFEVHRAALTVSDPIGAVLESLLGDAFALALTELKADSTKGLALAEALLAVLRSHAPRAFTRDDELHLIAERLTAIVERPAQVVYMRISSFGTLGQPQDRQNANSMYV